MAFPNTSNGLEHIFSNGFSQGLQWVREKNPTAFSNASNALEQMFQQLFSTLQRVKEKSQRFSQCLQRFIKRFQQVPNGYPTASAV